jgi:23S rRNA (uracil1939-C5)-methyltransferase
LVERLTIDHMGHRGDGAGRADAGPVYVAYALPGETVEVDPAPGQPDRRQLVRVATPSSERIDPICPYFGNCGGCALQHWAPARYREWKRALIVDQLRRAGIAATVADLVDAHGEGRRRAVLHARRGASGALEVGFAAARAQRIVPIDRCPILAPSLAGAIDAARAIADVLRAHGKPLDIHATATDGGIDIDVRGSGPLTAELTQTLARLAETRRLARITRHGELVTLRAEPTVRTGRAVVTLPPGAFLQATALGEETLARLVLAHVGSAETVADLFADRSRCG